MGRDGWRPGVSRRPCGACTDHCPRPWPPHLPAADTHSFHRGKELRFWGPCPKWGVGRVSHTPTMGWVSA